jgi:uncharacterized membrane protein YgaE (UPF0421/DUF939 family)
MPMEKTRKSSVRVGSKIGAAIGFIFFLVFGLVPGFYFGSSTAVLLLSKLIGPVEATTLARIAVVIGAIMGLFCAFSVFIVGGALFGGAVASLTDLLTARKKSEETDVGHKREGGESE